MLDNKTNQKLKDFHKKDTAYTFVRMRVRSRRKNTKKSHGEKGQKRAAHVPGSGTFRKGSSRSH